MLRTLLGNFVTARRLQRFPSELPSFSVYARVPGYLNMLVNAKVCTDYRRPRAVRGMGKIFPLISKAGQSLMRP